MGHTFIDWPHGGPKATREILEAVVGNSTSLDMYFATFMQKSGLSDN